MTHAGYSHIWGRARPAWGEAGATMIPSFFPSKNMFPAQTEEEHTFNGHQTNTTQKQDYTSNTLRNIRGCVWFFRLFEGWFWLFQGICSQWTSVSVDLACETTRSLGCRSYLHSDEGKEWQSPATTMTSLQHRGRDVTLRRPMDRKSDRNVGSAVIRGETEMALKSSIKVAGTFQQSHVKSWPCNWETRVGNCSHDEKVLQADKHREGYVVLPVTLTASLISAPSL